MSDHGLNLWLEDLRGGEVGLRLRIRSVKHTETTPFQRINVYDTLAFGRVFVLGDEIVLSEFDADTWAECLVHPALCAHPQPKSVLIIGGGDGGIAREVARHESIERISIVEIDQRVVDVSKQFFPAIAAGLDDPRVELIIDDAHRHLKEHTDSFDIIIIDGANLHDPAAEAVHQEEFSAALARRLNPGGSVVVPLGSPQYEPEVCRQACRILQHSFAFCHPYLVSVPSMPGGNVAIAWAASEGDPRTTPAEAEWMHTLHHWHPLLNARLFNLPVGIEKSLK